MAERITFISDLSTRSKASEAIRATGEFIADHADNILGEYPSGLVELEINAKFDGEGVVCVDIKRTHVVTERKADA